MEIGTLILLVLFQVKHYIADYPLQFPYMYENKGKDKGWFIALSNHALVHACFAMLISLLYLMITHFDFGVITNIGIMFGIGLFDYTTHMFTDRWKATKKEGPADGSFWRNLGKDQMIHHLVGIAIITFLVWL